MIDALALMASRGFKPIVIERSSERPGARGAILANGKLVPIEPAVEAKRR